MYKADSKIAEEFINHQEILDTMSYAETHKSNRALIESLIDKAARCKGLTHREAALRYIFPIIVSMVAYIVLIT